MKRSLFLCLVVLGLLAVSMPAADMTGFITCSKCRHTDEKGMDCATSCLRSGIPAVFYEQATQKFYNITNQDSVKAHYGTRVVVTGKVEGDRLTVANVKPVAAKGK